MYALAVDSINVAREIGKQHEKQIPTFIEYFSHAYFKDFMRARHKKCFQRREQFFPT